MTAPPVSRGARTVRERLAEHYRTTLPAALTAAELAWSLAPGTMPPPQLVDPYETEVLDRWPQISINVSQGKNFVHTDILPGAVDEYHVRYACRAFLWVRAQDRNPALALRDDYGAIMRQVTLATPGLEGGHTFRVDEKTMAETYSDASRVKGDRYLAGVRLDFELTHVETLNRLAVGSADSVSVEVTVLPGTQA